MKNLYILLIIVFSTKIIAQDINSYNATVTHINDKYRLKLSELTDSPNMNKVQSLTLNQSDLSKTSTSSLGGTSNITESLVLGLANYISTRAKDEISAEFISKFGKFIKSDDFIYFDTLFPTTITTFKILENDLFNYKAYIKTIQLAFQEDCKNLQVNLPLLINGRNKSKKINIDPDLFNFSINLAYKLLNGLSIEDFLEELSESLPEHNYLPAILESATFNDQIFPGIIEEIIVNSGKSESSQYATSLMVSSILEFKDFSLKANPTIDEQRNYYSNIIRYLKAIPNTSSDYNKFISYFEDILMIYFNIRSNEIPLGIVKTINLIVKIDPINLGKTSDKFIVNSKFKKAVKYVNFIASFAIAKDQNEVEAIIKNTALPVGSYRLKRKKNWYGFINSYAGFQYSHANELINGNKRYNSWGLNAPVGITIGYGCVSFFGQLIDVGQYLNVAEQDSFNLKDFPEVTLSNIFAPGIFLEFNVPSIFLTISPGYRWGPSERKDLNTDLIYRSRGAQISAKIDMPLYLICSKD
jgi:hypothetical protein